MKMSVKTTDRSTLATFPASLEITADNHTVAIDFKAEPTASEFNVVSRALAIFMSHICPTGLKTPEIAEAAETTESTGEQSRQSGA